MFEENCEGYMGRFGGRKKMVKCFNSVKIFKRKTKNKFTINTKYVHVVYYI